MFMCQSHNGYAEATAFCWEESGKQCLAGFKVTVVGVERILRQSAKGIQQ